MGRLKNKRAKHQKKNKKPKIHSDELDCMRDHKSSERHDESVSLSSLKHFSALSAIPDTPKCKYSPVLECLPYLFESDLQDFQTPKSSRKKLKFHLENSFETSAGQIKQCKSETALNKNSTPLPGCQATTINNSIKMISPIDKITPEDTKISVPIVENSNVPCFKDIISEIFVWLGTSIKKGLVVLKHFFQSYFSKNESTISQSVDVYQAQHLEVMERLDKLSREMAELKTLVETLCKSKGPVGMGPPIPPPPPPPMPPLLIQTATPTSRPMKTLRKTAKQTENMRPQITVDAIKNVQLRKTGTTPMQSNSLKPPTNSTFQQVKLRPVITKSKSPARLRTSPRPASLARILKNVDTNVQ